MKAIHLISLIFIIIVGYACKPINTTLFKYKYRNDYWVKDQNPSKVRSSSNYNKLPITEVIEVKELGEEKAIKPSKRIIALNEVDKEIASSANEKQTYTKSDIEEKILSHKKGFPDSPSKENKIENFNPKKGKPPVFGVLSLVFGSISFFAAIWVPLIAFGISAPPVLAVYFLFMIPAIVFGIVSLARKENKKGLAIAGLIAAGVSLMFFALFSYIGYNFFYVY